MTITKRREDFFLDLMRQHIISFDENGHVYREYDEFKNKVVYKRIDYPRKNSYSQVTYRKNHMVYECSAHRLVYTFLFGIPEGMQINHRDGNKSNNCIENLEAVTVRQNIHHAIYVLGARLGSRNQNAKLSPEDVEKIFELRSAGLTLQKIADIFKVTKSNVSKILRGEIWKIRQ